MDALNTILKIPERSLVNKKITKAFFKRNFDLTISERTLLDDPNIISSLEWLASIAPNNSNINSYKDENCTFEEVQIIIVQTSETDFEKNVYRIADLIQKYIPYPVLLCIRYNQVLVLNACDKKINQNDNNRRTVEKKYTTEPINLEVPTERQHGFISSLAFDEMDKINLKTYYESYVQRIIALHASDVIGAFIPRIQSRTEKDMLHLEQIETLTRDIETLQNKAKKESQLAARVQLNTEIQQKRIAIEQLKNLLTA